MHRKIWIIATAGLLGLAACGETVLEQGLIGAAGGAGVSAAVDGNIASGAAVGAAGNIVYCQKYPSRCN